ncbi:hypothetical protein SAMN05421594_1502 [Chryseobacterium oleae]|uniref:Uncharacterized protein n=1 Tax=Chryseobacterium oleae TaxID=491207 RepID=A0A1I4X785_CHROL|nr:hypothetical protein [Chryseobacterium oleae]SFN21230.1 hypothetical protein SAMN05421594_1502 [Chryseobacterium oleae]
MKSKLTILLFFLFQLGFSQIPCISKNFKFNNFIDAFIYTNNDENFKPDLSLIHVSSLYYKGKGYMITITRDNIKSIMVKPNSEHLEFFKYKNLDLLLQGNTTKDIKFLKKIISNKVVSNNSKVEFIKPYNNVSYDPYQWFLLFDKKMNLISYELPEEEETIKEVFKKFNIISHNKASSDLQN